MKLQCHFAIISSSLILGSLEIPAIAQEAADPTPAAVQQKIREWVKTRKQIGEEAADWETEKRSLTDLNEIRRKEAAQIDELIAAAGNRLKDAEKQRTELLAEEESLRAWRATFEQRIIKLEADLRAQLPKFPPPLRDKAGEAITRLEDPQPDTPLQNRYRDVLAILSEVGNFQSVVTIDTELREINGAQVEVEVLYLGLAQAWYADRTGKHAGSGHPGPEGWIWTADASLAGRVREAIAIQRKLAPPAFVGLPFTATSAPDAK
jgi:hypothetical protein